MRLCLLVVLVLMPMLAEASSTWQAGIPHTCMDNGEPRVATSRWVGPPDHRFPLTITGYTTAIHTGVSDVQDIGGFFTITIVHAKTGRTEIIGTGANNIKVVPPTTLPTPIRMEVNDTIVLVSGCAMPHKWQPTGLNWLGWPLFVYKQVSAGIQVDWGLFYR